MKRLCGMTAMVFLALTPATAVAANQYTVTTTVDEATDPGTGCSLREAINHSDTNATSAQCPATTISGSTNLITFSPSLGSSPTINLLNSIVDFGQLDVTTNPLNIVGPGVTVNGAPAAGQRIIAVGTGASLGITGMTITGGSLSTPGAQGGAISAAANLTLTNATIAGNSANDTAANATTDGGGIFVSSSGTLTLNNSVVANNFSNATVTSPGSDSTARGGGIVANGPLVMHFSTVVGNHAISSNNSPGDGSAEASGGGLRTAGTVQIDHSTITNNDASAHNEAAAPQEVLAQGGGLLTLPPLGATVELSTITNNQLSATSTQAASFIQRGGGLAIESGATDSYVSSTIARNGLSPTSTTSGTIRGMNFFTSGGGAKSASNDIIAYPGAVGTNCFGGTFVVAGNANVDFPQDVPNACFTPGPLTLNTDPLLGPLGSNGGPTATVAPMPTSPVIDQGRSSDQVVDPTHDQRGLTRPVDFPGLTNGTFLGANGTDIGAVEVQQACAGQSTPTSSCATTTPPPATTAAPTGLRAAALKKCKKKRSKNARKKCRKRANALPV
jgi:CSLREA domain-containing protein